MTSILVAALVITGCGPKKVQEVAPIEGWHAEPEWAGACYHPPQYDKLDETSRRVARQKSLEAMMSQWQGGREDGISFSPDTNLDVETVLLGRPENIEEVSYQNLEWCKAAMQDPTQRGAWQSWHGSLSGKLMEGECVNPFHYQLIQYLDIGTGWQENVHFCKGNRVIIEATRDDKFRISADGPWINAEGDLSQPATDPELPCNFEGCYRGQLIGRFITEAGVETVFPIGVFTQYEAPEHGYFSFTINDDTYFDNVWRKDGVVIDRTAVTLTPAE